MVQMKVIILLQTSGCQVQLENSNTAVASFNAYLLAVTKYTTLTFSLPVTDNEDAVSTNAATTNVLVKNVNQPPSNS
jgi:hypothetical protein